jgi:hypothetical protein
MDISKTEPNLVPVPIVENAIPENIVPNKIIENVREKISSKKGNFGGGILIPLAKNVKAILFLCFIIAIVVVIILMFVYGYPRIFALGHTESGFDDFVEEYIKTIADYFGQLADSHPPIKDFLDTFQKEFGYSLIGADLSRNESIEIHVFFMFYFDIESKKSVSPAYEVLKADLRNPGLEKLQSMYNPSSSATIDMKNEYIEKFINVKKTFDIARVYIATKTKDETKGTKEGVLFKILTLMLYKYFDGSNSSTIDHGNLKRMFLMRKTGGFANFSILKLYLEDYFQYVFFEKIKKDIWGSFVEDLKSLADRTLKAITADFVLQWFLNLPGNLAGTNENFQVEKFKTDYRELFSNPYSKDTVEPFIDSLIKIAKTFVSLFEIVISVVNVISDPIKFIKFLIGSVIAIILYIIYFILVNLQIAVAIAYIWLVTSNVLQTIFWTLLFLIFAIFYSLLCIIDLPLGGFIMRSLRCENLPDAWAKVANWHKGNNFSRTFFCSRRCSKSFYPSKLWPMCMKQSKDEPTFAPQQIIFNTFKNSEYISKVQKAFYSHTPNHNYYLNMTQDQKKNMWNEIYKNKQSYTNDCRYAYVDYDSITISMCEYFYENKDSLSDETQKEIGSLCKSTYCKNEGDYNFCKTNIDDALIEEKGVSEKNYIKMIIFCIIVGMIIFLTTMFLIKYRYTF